MQLQLCEECTVSVYEPYGIETPAGIITSLGRMERKFQLKFERYYHFSEECLACLHAPDEEMTLCWQPNEVVNSSAQDLSVLLEKVGNYRKVSKAQATKYLNALLELYRPQVARLDNILKGEHVHIVGIEREGATLARHLNLLGPSRGYAPSAKRERFNGLVVGLSGIPTLPPGSDIVIIDGAIATGATLVAFLLETRPRKATILAAHAAFPGIRALSRLAKGMGIDIALHAPITALSLDDNYYAIGSRPNRKAVGDLGDTLELLKKPTRANKNI